ncbi:MAG: hypothetical protein WC485_00305 [Opitutaceae bacterium]
MTKPLQPGPELDEIVCKAVHIPHAVMLLPSGDLVSPRVSTTPSFEQFCQIMTWLRDKTLYCLEPQPSTNQWRVYVVLGEEREYIYGDTIAHAVCLAVAAVVEAEGKP